MLEHEDVRSEMGRLGREYVDTYYRWDIVVDKLTNLFNSAIEG